MKAGSRAISRFYKPAYPGWVECRRWEMAADSILFIGWTRAERGREREALETFGMSMGFWAKQVAAGKIESFEPVLLDRHGGDMNGFVLIRGSAANLAELANSEEFRDLLT